MRIFPPEYDRQAIALHLRRAAMKGFQRTDDAASFRYIDACSCGVNLPEAPNSICLILTRDSFSGDAIGWHLSACCVTDQGYRGYVPAEGEHWVGLIFGPYAHRAIAKPLEDRSIIGMVKDVRHWIAECDWADQADPLVSLQGLL